MKFTQFLFNEQISDDEEEQEDEDLEVKWNMNSPDCDDICVKANALAEFLGADKEDIEEDKYKHYEMTQFKVDGNTYAIGDDDEVEQSARDYVEQLIDDIGYTGFRQGFVYGYIDEEQVLESMREDMEWRISDSPDSYLSDEDRVLSEEQEQKIQYYQERIEFYRRNIEKFESLRDEVEDESEDEDQIANIDSRIEELTELIEDLDQEIIDIEESPEGDYPDSVIQEYIDNFISDARDNIVRYMSEYGFEVEDFVDKDAFIQGVINEDGYGMLGSYDGDYDTINFNHQTFYIVRVD